MLGGTSSESDPESTSWVFPSGYFDKSEGNPSEPSSQSESIDSVEEFLDSGDEDLPFSRARRRRAKRSDSSVVESKPLSPERLERRAKNVVLHQLSRQAKSAQQLREVLEKREIPSEIAESVIERFTEAGLINDLQFAITVAHSRRNTRGLSTAAIRRELVKKGVGQAEIDEALREFAAEDELETAVRIAVKRMRSMSKLEPEVRRRRMLGFLARKGYPGSIAYRALKLAEDQSEG